MNIKEQLKKGKNIYELPLKVCFYARVSTLNEMQKSSIINQINYFKNYIKNIPSWNLIAGYIDEGLSGKEVSKRTNFLNMIKDAKLHKFDLILTKSVSRFARNTIDSIKYTEELLTEGIGVYFINDNINTLYSDSEFRLTLMASIAQDELRKLSENVKFGLNQSIERGIVLGNNNILGYKKNKGKLTIDKKESQIIKDIYYLFLKKTNNYSEITRIINKKYQKKLDSSTTKRILTNPKYKGYYCGKKTEVIDYKKNKRKKRNISTWITYKDYKKVPPIIEEETWNRVNKIIKNIKKNQTRYNISCALHQRKLLLKTKKYKTKKYHYYICPNCIRITEKLLDKINNITPLKEIIIIPGQELTLKIKH